LAPDAGNPRMQRFNIKDRIVVLPQFGHLYQNHLGLIVAVKLDPFRPIFNEYTIEFPDGSTANLFEFQILEDFPEYTVSIATLVFDSRLQKPVKQFRGKSQDRRIVLQTPTVDIDMRIRLSKSPVSIVGQIWERAVSVGFAQTEVTLIRHNIATNKTTTDDFGTFVFDSVASGALNIEVLIPADKMRLLGTFTI
jgi:hypothetical protein